MGFSIWLCGYLDVSLVREMTAPDRAARIEAIRKQVEDFRVVVLASWQTIEAGLRAEKYLPEVISLWVNAASNLTFLLAEITRLKGKRRRRRENIGK